MQAELLEPGRVHEEVRSVCRDVAGLLDVLTHDVDVANLTAGAVILAIKVNLGLRVTLHHGTYALRHWHFWILRATKDVSHDGYGSKRCGLTERQIQDCA